MKHLFIVNPTAGKKKNAKAIAARIEEVFAGRADEYEIKFTEYPGHATELAKAAADTGESVRIYAIGGDGTVHEVLAGCRTAANVELAPFPNGTGNDFVKAFPDRDFSDIKALVQGDVRAIDLLKCDDELAINIINCGFDADVAHNVDKFKKVFSGNVAYYISVFYTVLKRITCNMKVSVDGGDFFDGRATLAVIANGRVYGGGFLAAPEALTDDGLADVVVAKGMSRLKVTQFVDRYKRGEHDSLADLLTKNRGKKITVSSDGEFCICLDGECRMTTCCTVEVLPGAVKVVLPHKD